MLAAGFAGTSSAQLSEDQNEYCVRVSEWQICKRDVSASLALVGIIDSGVTVYGYSASLELEAAGGTPIELYADCLADQMPADLPSYILRASGWPSDETAYQISIQYPNADAPSRSTATGRWSQVRMDPMTVSIWPFMGDGEIEITVAFEFPGEWDRSTGIISADYDLRIVSRLLNDLCR
ncbi:hypothetical protein AWH62_07635 [Maricaulis sp. W15]|nr:hypothetical protein AWH62_07635 [Maricaulis sp. W15]